MKKRNLDNPEQVIKSLEHKKPKNLIDYFTRSNQNFQEFYA